MTANKRLQFRLRLSDAETEATTWSLPDTERVTIQLESEIYGITSNEQKRLKKKFSIRLIKFEASWETIGIQALRKTIEPRMIHFGSPKIHLVSYTFESIRRMGSGDNYTTDISERLHIANVKRHIDLATKSITFDRCLSKMTILRRHCDILHSKAGTIITLQMFSTYCLLLINGEVHAEPICYVSKQSRTSPLSALYHSSYII
jgi:hypothetical protein